MTKEELFTTLKTELEKIIHDNNLESDEIKINSKGLTPTEAIGITTRQDFPIINGREVMVLANYKDSYGQAFTDTPALFNGTLKEILDLDIVNDDYARGLFIASLNAVMKHLNLTDRTIHCKNEEPEMCALEFAKFTEANYKDKKIAIIGYQPAILEALSSKYNVRILDLNPEHVGKVRYGVKVENGIDDYEEVVLNWADVIYCTGSTLCNGSIVNFLDLDKEVIFFGTTIAGTAEILNLKRACFCSH
ncbi:MAG: Rossmann-like domain-containing protein [Intestinibacter sp.]